MSRVLTRFALGFSACLMLSPLALAGKFNTADFPLRVHILYRNGIRHYHGLGGGMSSLDAVDGLGQANLFQNGEPMGFDFNYSCSQPIVPTPAYETFMARWKKPGRVIEIVMPVMGGKSGDMNSCDLNVSMKQDTVYVQHNGSLTEEPAAQFKVWMAKHEYDPEHGKNMPVNPEPAPAQNGAAPQQPAAPQQGAANQ